MKQTPLFFLNSDDYTYTISHPTYKYTRDISIDPGIATGPIRICDLFLYPYPKRSLICRKSDRECKRFLRSKGQNSLDTKYNCKKYLFRRSVQAWLVVKKTNLELPTGENQTLLSTKSVIHFSSFYSGYSCSQYCKRKQIDVYKK